MYLKEEINNTITVEKSKFICYIKEINDVNEYKEYHSLIKKNHYDASHVCSALICQNIIRSSDDGEPSGTAGLPILNVLQKNNLENICAIVVRYFGGIKLGTGGLVRAYGNSVKECLKKAIFIEKISCPKYSLSLNYDQINKIDYYLKNNTIITDIKYDEKVNYEFIVEDLNIIKNIEELTKGYKPSFICEEIIEKVVK